jgi:hypothetical protein
VPIDEVDHKMDDDRRDTPPAETVRRPRETGHAPRPPFSDSDRERGDEESGRPLKLDQDKRKAGRSGDQR